VRRVVARGCLAAALGYVALCVVARLGYRVLLYPAPDDPPYVTPAGAARLELRDALGAAVVATEFPPPDERARTVVLFHGNGETMGNRVALTEGLRARGLGVVLVEYPGYGMASASGPPTEAGLYGAAAAALDALETQGIGPARVALVGISLGTGVAAEMAARGRGAALVLVSPFTSITDMARRTVPFLPVTWICPDRYDTIGKATRIREPTLVIHGDEDEVVPFAMGQEVAGAIAGASLRVVHGGHHNDLLQAWGPEMIEAIALAAAK
jgi:pimeloyl-ACP methyl ester carboxylesterase